MPPKAARFSLLPRKKNTDKSRYGHVLVLAGSRSMSGAPQLVSRACLAAGVGLVTAGLPKSVRPVFAKQALAEVMMLELPETAQGTLAPGAYPKIISFIRDRKIRVVAIGPGLSQDAGVFSLVRKLTRAIPVSVVLDADGLNAFKGRTAELKEHRGPLVLTPHAKEFERLFGKKVPVTAGGRAALAKKLSRLYDVTIVLKGRRTLVAQDRQIYENRTGNPGMAKGGTGDVLTGVIAAFIAQGLSPFKAACWGVYFHGKAGDLAVRTKSELGLLAGDIIDALPRVFRRAK